MRLFRLGRWGSQIRPLACRHCSPFAASNFSRNVQSRQLSSSIGCDDGDLVKRKRGRPRKSDFAAIQSSMAPPSAAIVTGEPTPSAPPELTVSVISSDQHPERPTPARTPQTLPVLLDQLPSPPPQTARASAKLSALHARLSLPSKLPQETLARALIHRTADADPRFNNSSLAVLGKDLLSYYGTESLMTRFPRLPMIVLSAAQYAYVGPRTLAALTREWGVEPVAEPGGEVDPGLLQFKRAPPGTPSNIPSTRHRNRRGQAVEYRRGVTSRIVNDDEFGDIDNTEAEAKAKVATLEEASATFVNALVGAIYLHTGAGATKSFFRDHFLSRHLDMGSLFSFTQPTRDLSRLCAREGFDAPIARLESETGRLSRHPVFVVGVYSGVDKLGEGAGSSLNEARFRAAVSALKGWYLYSPLDMVVPSDANQSSKAFKPIMIDLGEVVA